MATMTITRTETQTLTTTTVAPSSPVSVNFPLIKYNEDRKGLFFSYPLSNNGFQVGGLGAENCNLIGTLHVQFPTDTMINIKEITLRVKVQKNMTRLMKRSVLKTVSLWKPEPEEQQTTDPFDLPFTIDIPSDILKSIKVTPGQRLIEFELAATVYHKTLMLIRQEGKEEVSIWVPMYLHRSFLLKEMRISREINPPWETDLYKVFLNKVHFLTNEIYGLAVVVSPGISVKRLRVCIKEYYTLPNAAFQKRYIVNNEIDGSTFLTLNKKNARGIYTVEDGSKVKEMTVLIPTKTKKIYDFLYCNSNKVYHMITITISLENGDKIKLKRQCFISDIEL